MDDASSAKASPQPAPAPAPARIELVLVSHTNVGKTTLARTLLGQDVGEVRDAAHVTQQSEAHELLVTGEGDTLMLWDTPGLGDSARLVRRLAGSSNPVGWFLSQVWDRWTDRAFFLSQQAMRATRDHADVVLYPVNATEAPSQAGYLAHELKLLAWLDKPVLVLLNQTGLAAADQDAAQDELQRWQAHLRGQPHVRGVLPLDAFTRCWVHEQNLLDALGALVAPDKAPGWQRLQRDWRQRNLRRFGESLAVVARQLVDAAQHQLSLAAPDSGASGLLRRLGGGGGSVQERGHQALQGVVEDGRARTTHELLRLHGLLGRSAHPFWKRLDAADVVSRVPLDPLRAGISGAIASGAATGVAADLAVGGLSLGTGALLGALAGAVAFVVGSEGVNRARGVKEASVRLSDAALRALLQDALLKYLAVAHFGRGRGEFEHDALPAAWVVQAHQRVEAAAGELDAVFAALRTSEMDATQAGTRLQALARRLALELLAWMYPEAQLPSQAAENRHPGVEQ